ncbi:hypothetical protein BGLA2_800018 [Burkholderia gladioli]|nr:hypothetical protein BGLA2_800018 [Burkholderia gladioli]
MPATVQAQRNGRLWSPRSAAWRSASQRPASDSRGKRGHSRIATLSSAPPPARLARASPARCRASSVSTRDALDSLEREAGAEGFMRELGEGGSGGRRGRRCRIRGGWIDCSRPRRGRPGVTHLFYFRADRFNATALWLPTFDPVDKPPRAAGGARNSLIQRSHQAGGA